MACEKARVIYIADRRDCCAFNLYVLDNSSTPDEASVFWHELPQHIRDVYLQEEKELKHVGIFPCMRKRRTEGRFRSEYTHTYALYTFPFF